MSESLITKQAISNGLKQVMKEKTFDKVRISDITKACGLNAKRFIIIFKINTSYFIGFFVMKLSLY